MCSRSGLGPRGMRTSSSATTLGQGRQQLARRVAVRPSATTPAAAASARAECWTSTTSPAGSWVASRARGPRPRWRPCARSCWAAAFPSQPTSAAATGRRYPSPRSSSATLRPMRGLASAASRSCGPAVPRSWPRLPLHFARTPSLWLIQRGSGLLLRNGASRSRSVRWPCRATCLLRSGVFTDSSSRTVWPQTASPSCAASRPPRS
mmetsp:Transcript_17327/g.47851  ORF Transcript_17327/g.47851 Transcript_17327/m.47851 type:complete len:207 (-) Transcript_17327:129-749(-)